MAREPDALSKPLLLLRSRSSVVIIQRPYRRNSQKRSISKSRKKKIAIGIKTQTQDAVCIPQAHPEARPASTAWPPRCEFVLAAIAQNLRRLAALVARPPPAKALCIA